MSTGEGAPGGVRGHLLEEVTFVLGSQRMKGSFSSREEKGYPGRAHFQSMEVGEIMCPRNRRWFSVAPAWEARWRGGGQW